MKIKIEGAVYFRTKLDYQGEQRFAFHAGPVLDFGRCKVVAPHTIEVEAPEGFDPRVLELEALRERRKAVHDEFAAAVMEIDQRINSLLAIENAAEAVPV